ncbi:MAG: hypothetical protein AAF085_06140 [Planctomycetota bacterium]
MTIAKVPCKQCGTEIQEPTARRNNGLCGPCFKGTYECVDCGRKVMKMEGVDQSDQLCIDCSGKRGRKRNQEALETGETIHVQYNIEAEPLATYNLINAVGMILSVTNSGRVIGQVGKTVEFETIGIEMMDTNLRMALKTEPVDQFEIVVYRIDTSGPVRLETSDMF